MQEEAERRRVPAKENVMKRIIARLGVDQVSPYSKSCWPYIPYVEQSNHPRFVKGTRFDYGFLKIALENGYEVVIKQPKEAEK